MGILSEDKNIEELEEENHKQGLKLSIARKRSLIAEANKKHGSGWWKLFSSDGSKSGINWDALQLRL